MRKAHKNIWNKEKKTMNPLIEELTKE
ncbi:50S ribosomal protein L19, partial [Enterococcus faecium]|nr:50S ribosomal protein L19 [Enterococcus faecium]